ncbi:uncharacterized protein LOC106176771 isoform X2 [Lingula anatina]|uniref:Uncharacterized protein LOC106176771 isoform X2 n=1 Tax=Lingula anatina TaxID=7574 RepID=A0A1S3JXH5_LINAN|nr:uncharacterized protein LOC106176771 isoform X2 [Lingula anatina]|eukprot:XP_013414744.1 uncharacterized protein LOC106176771 isoform X2 [Lingula anatina]
MRIRLDPWVVIPLAVVLACLLSHKTDAITLDQLIARGILPPELDKCKGPWRVHGCFGGNGKRTQPEPRPHHNELLAKQLNLAEIGILKKILKATRTERMDFLNSDKINSKSLSKHQHDRQAEYRTTRLPLLPLQSNSHLTPEKMFDGNLKDNHNRINLTEIYFQLKRTTLRRLMLQRKWNP